MSRAIRWILVPFSTVVVWSGAVWLGFKALNVLDSFCPPKLVESGACVAPWHEPSVEALVFVFAAVAAFAIVGVSALVAPAHKLRVAALTFAGGAIFALHVVLAAEMYGPFLTAAAGGSVALWLINARDDRPHRREIPGELP